MAESLRAEQTTTLEVKEVQFYERMVHFRLPFRFGVATLTEEPQVFVRTLVEFKNGKRSWGLAAEVLAPKWFDKNPQLSNDDNFDQLRTSMSIAAAFYQQAEGGKSPFELFYSNYQKQISACAQEDLNALIAGYGQALLDRSIIDAVCRHNKISFFEAVRSNCLGIHELAITPELSGFSFTQFLSQLKPPPYVYARHTVGLLDPLTETDVSRRLEDGLPETLEEILAFYANVYFKLKLRGQASADVERLQSIADVLDRLEEPYYCTLDGNEQYDDIDGILDLWDRLAQDSSLKRLVDAVLLIEQPIVRTRALSQRVDRLSCLRPVIIDESDCDLDAFPIARSCGYLGVSSKQCKGVYRSILNAARCQVWNAQERGPRFLMTGEDLTIQPGLALQQDLALAALLGLNHVERNGHHYVRGMQGVSIEEQRSFVDFHGDLYRYDGDITRVHIEKGTLSLASLHCPGLGTAVQPDWAGLVRMR